MRLVLPSRAVPRPSSLDCADGAASYAQGFAVNERLGDLPMGRLQHSPKGGAGDLHLYRTMLLVQSYTVGQSDCLELIQRDDHAAYTSLLPRIRREQGGDGMASDSATA